MMRSAQNQNLWKCPTPDNRHTCTSFRAVRCASCIQVVACASTSIPCVEPRTASAGHCPRTDAPLSLMRTPPSFQIAECYRSAASQSKSRARAKRRRIRRYNDVRSPAIAAHECTKGKNVCRAYRTAMHRCHVQNIAILANQNSLDKSAALQNGSIMQKSPALARAPATGLEQQKSQPKPAPSQTDFDTFTIAIAIVRVRVITTAQHLTTARYRCLVAVPDPYHRKNRLRSCGR